MAKTKSVQARAAAAIRKDLKAAFPGTSFGVRSEAFAGGDAVTIEWNDGPTTDEAERITSKYQVTAYLDTNQRDDIPRVSYVQTYRGISRAAYADLVHHLNALYGWSLEVDTECPYNAITSSSDGFDPPGCRQSEYIWMQFRKTSYVHIVTTIYAADAVKEVR